MTLTFTVFVPFIIALLVLLEGIHRVSQKPSTNIMAGIWLGIGILLFILALIGTNSVSLG